MTEPWEKLSWEEKCRLDLSRAHAEHKAQSAASGERKLRRLVALLPDEADEASWLIVEQALKGKRKPGRK